MIMILEMFDLRKGGFCSCVDDTENVLHIFESWMFMIKAMSALMIIERTCNEGEEEDYWDVASLC